MTDETHLKELQAKRDRIHSRAFVLALEVLAIFGFPALIAVLAGKYFETTYETRTPLYIFLAVAFVLSWIILIARVVRLDRELRSLDKEIKEEKEKQEAKK